MIAILLVLSLPWVAALVLFLCLVVHDARDERRRYAEFQRECEECRRRIAEFHATPPGQRHPRMLRDDPVWR